MADTVISAMTAASALTGTELIPTVQSAANKKLTPAQLATYIAGATLTLTGKTLTSPVINGATGMVKGDVGLGNVDNTSDATKNAAAVSLTNKIINGSSNTLSNLPAAGILGVIPIANLATGTPNGSKFIRDDGTLQAIAGGGDALVASPLSQFAATTSAQLAGVLSDETGSGKAVFGTNPTLVGYTLTGVPVTTYTAMGASAVDVTLPGNTYAASSNATLTYSATPSAGARTILKITADSTDRTITIPSTWSTSRNGNITSVLVTALSTLVLLLEYTGTRWEVSGDPPAVTGTGNYVCATSPTITSAALVTPALGTPASGTLTSCTGLPVSTGVAGLGTSVGTFLGTPTSANLKAALTDETGSGAVVFATNPTLVSPIYTSQTISASAIDWAAADSHYKTLAANTTFTFANAADGKQIVVAVTNTASNWTVTWPTVKWSGGVAPTQTTGAKVDIYTFIQINGAIYGSVVANCS